MTPLERSQKQNLRLQEALLPDTWMSEQCSAGRVETHDWCFGVSPDPDVKAHCSCPCHLDWLWLARLDKHFACRVTRVQPLVGRLQVVDMRTGEMILSTDVSLDVDADYIASWKAEAAWAVDNRR